MWLSFQQHVQTNYIGKSKPRVLDYYEEEPPAIGEAYAESFPFRVVLRKWHQLRSTWVYLHQNCVMRLWCAMHQTYWHQLGVSSAIEVEAYIFKFNEILKISDQIAYIVYHTKILLVPHYAKNDAECIYIDIYQFTNTSLRYLNDGNWVLNPNLFTLMLI